MSFTWKSIHSLLGHLSSMWTFFWKASLRTDVIISRCRVEILNSNHQYLFIRQSAKPHNCLKSSFILHLSSFILYHSSFISRLLSFSAWKQNESRFQSYIISIIHAKALAPASYQQMCQWQSGKCSIECLGSSNFTLMSSLQLITTLVLTFI